MFSLNEPMIDLKEIKMIKKPKVGTFSLYIPEEIFYAAGIIPIRIFGESPVYKNGDSGFLHSNMCSYIQDCFKAGMRGDYDFIEGIIMANTCDAQIRLFDNWKYYNKKQYSFMMNVPKDSNDLSFEYFKGQVIKLISFVKDSFNVNITTESLLDAIKLCNKTRQLLQDIYKKKNEGYEIVGSADFVNIVKSAMCNDKKQINEDLTYLLNSTVLNQKICKDKKGKVIICGSFFDNLNIINAIEEYGVEVVCEENDIGLRYFEGCIDKSNTPIEAISLYYFNKISNSNITWLDQRIQRLEHLSEQYKINGIIYFSLKFCDNNLMDYIYIKEKMAKKRIPILFLEGERNMDNIEHIKTRIQTFLEINC